MVVIARLVWDSWNVEHISKHDVVQTEVEFACHGDHVVLQSYQERLLLIAPVGTRMLAVILNPQADEGVYLPHHCP